MSFVNEDGVKTAILAIGGELKNTMTAHKDDLDDGGDVAETIRIAGILFSMINHEHQDPEIKKLKKELIDAQKAMNGNLGDKEKERIEIIISTIP